VLQLADGLGLDLAHALARDPELPADCLERERIPVAVQAVAELDHGPSALGKFAERAVERRLAEAHLELLVGARLLRGEEVAEATGISVDEAKRVMKISKHPISLDRPIGDSDDSYFGDFIEDEKADNPVESATQEMLKDKIEQVLKTLTYREREIIKLRYGIGDGYTYTLEEVGRIFKVTRERVRQVEAKAIRKLQHPVRARKLEGFLPGGLVR